MITPPPPPPPPPELAAGGAGATGTGVTGALLEDDGLAGATAGVTTGWGLGLGLGWRSAGSGTLASGRLITAADEAAAFNGTGPGAPCGPLGALARPSTCLLYTS